MHRWTAGKVTGRWCTVAIDPYSNGNDLSIRETGCWVYNVTGVPDVDSEMTWNYKQRCRFRRLLVAKPWLTSPIVPWMSVNGNPVRS